MLSTPGTPKAEMELSPLRRTLWMICMAAVIVTTPFVPPLLIIGGSFASGLPVHSIVVLTVWGIMTVAAIVIAPEHFRAGLDRQARRLFVSRSFATVSLVLILWFELDIFRTLVTQDGLVVGTTMDSSRSASTTAVLGIAATVAILMMATVSAIIRIVREE